MKKLSCFRFLILGVFFFVGLFVIDGAQVRAESDKFECTGTVALAKKGAIISLNATGAYEVRFGGKRIMLSFFMSDGDDGQSFSGVLNAEDKTFILNADPNSEDVQAVFFGKFEREGADLLLKGELSAVEGDGKPIEDQRYPNTEATLFCSAI